MTIRVVAQGPERAAMAKEIGPTVICERKMTLPAGGAGRLTMSAPSRTGDPDRRSSCDASPHILFLCVANSAAARWPKDRPIPRPSRVKISSADRPRIRPPQAIQSSRRSASISPAIGPRTGIHRRRDRRRRDHLCAEEICPVFPGKVHRTHWGLPDPAGIAGTEETRLNAFRSVRTNSAAA